MTSILTNIAAMSALQTLRSINSGMEETQARVSSGMRVETASDNAAYWSIATTMRSDNMALSAVQDALGLGAAKVDTAYAGMESAIDVVKEIKAKLVAATEEGVDKSKIQEEIDQLQDQLASIASSASFSGENWLQANLGGSTESLAKSVVGSFVRTEDSVSIKRISHQLSASTVLFDTNEATGVDKAGILDATLKLDEKRATLEITKKEAITVTGEALAADASNLLTVTAEGNEVYTTSGGDTYMRYNTKNADASVTQALDASGKDLWVKVKYAAVSAIPAADTEAALAPKAIAGADVYLQTGAAGAATGYYYIQTAPVIETATVAATNAENLTAAGVNAVDLATGVVNIGTDYYIKIGADDTWVKADRVAKSTPAASTATSAGVADNQYQNGDKAALSNTTHHFFIDTDNTSIAGALGEVETDAGISVSDLDITELGDLANKLGYTEKEVLDMMIQYVDDKLNTATSAAADLGSIKMRIDMQEDFVHKLTDSIDSGIGRLVDADLNEESTRLKALQTQQQLAVQALSIANSSSESILQLFR